jgi:transcriptional regulator with XRE-family HTH domain
MSDFDPDFGKTGFARHLFRLRFRHLKLSQRAFADRFGLSYSVVRDAEHGARPTPSLRLIVAAIADNPARMAAIARLAAQPCHCGEGDPYTCCAEPAVTVRLQICDTNARARARVGE